MNRISDESDAQGTECPRDRTRGISYQKNRIPNESDAPEESDTRGIGYSRNQNTRGIGCPRNPILEESYGRSRLVVPVPAD